MRVLSENNVIHKKKCRSEFDYCPNSFPSLFKNRAIFKKWRLMMLHVFPSYGLVAWHVQWTDMKRKCGFSFLFTPHVQLTRNDSTLLLELENLDLNNSLSLVLLLWSCIINYFLNTATELGKKWLVPYNLFFFNKKK